MLPPRKSAFSHSKSATNHQFQVHNTILIIGINQKAMAEISKKSFPSQKNKLNARWGVWLKNFHFHFKKVETESGIRIQACEHPQFCP